MKREKKEEGLWGVGRHRDKERCARDMEALLPVNIMPYFPKLGIVARALDKDVRRLLQCLEVKHAHALGHGGLEEPVIPKGVRGPRACDSRQLTWLNLARGFRDPIEARRVRLSSRLPAVLNEVVNCLEHRELLPHFDAVVVAILGIDKVPRSSAKVRARKLHCSAHNKAQTQSEAVRVCMRVCHFLGPSLSVCVRG